MNKLINVHRHCSYIVILLVSDMPLIKLLYGTLSRSVARYSPTFITDPYQKLKKMILFKDL